MDQIKAPFTPEQVEVLKLWQACDWVHPFTCGGDRSDQAHQDYAKLHNLRDTGILVPSTTGWTCPVCGYTQDWAWDGMTKGAPSNPIAAIPIYLGDSVYAEIHNGMILLTTNNGYPDDPRNKIYLEKSVYRMLREYAQKATDFEK